jgi:hypothetical protein
VADIFKDGTQAQDSSYLEADTFVAASTCDPAFVVSIVCSPAFPETEVLLKAREISHQFKASGSQRLEKKPANACQFLLRCTLWDWWNQKHR